MASHTVPWQHCQPTPTSLGQGCIGVWLQCNLPPTLLAEWLGSFMWCCGNTGWHRMTDIKLKRKSQQLTLEKKFSHCSCHGLDPWFYDHEFRAVLLSYPHPSLSESGLTTPGSNRNCPDLVSSKHTHVYIEGCLPESRISFFSTFYGRGF